jgi:hypothetical protein
MARPLLAIGGIALIGIGAAIGLGWWWPTSAQEDRQVTQRIDTVSLDTNSGDVHIRADNVATTTVHQRFHYNGSRPNDAFRVTGGRLELTGCGHNCSVDYDVVVPRGATVTGTASSGDVTVDAASSIDVTANSGEVRVRDGAGPVKVQANSGDVSVALAAPQDVQVEANSGDVHVVVPQDRYRVQAQTESGEQKINISTDPAAPHLLDLHANSGDVTINPA